MKRFIVISAIISAFVVLNSCEQHDWKTTKLLHVDKAEKHDSHTEHAEGNGEHAEKKEDHGSSSEGH